MKKISIIVLALALSMGAKAQTILLGDATNDGVIDIADVTTTVNIILGKTPTTSIQVGGGPEKFIRMNNLSGSFLVDDEVSKDYKSGYEYVDLGLPSKTLWCATNVGGLVPTDAGTATAWADINLPEGWMLPTTVQVQELLDNCNITDDGKCLTVASKTDPTKTIVVSKETPLCWSADGTTFGFISSYVTTIYVRPVITPNNDSEIGQGEDNSPFCVKEEKNEEVGIWDLY